MSENKSISAEVLAALPEHVDWSGRPQPGDLAGLPGSPAVYLLVATTDLPVQLATTQHLRRLTLSRLTDAERVQHGKADLAEVVRGVRWRPVYSVFEARWWYYRLAREMYPKRYRRMISFGPAFFLHVNLDDRVPDIAVNKQVWQAPGEMAGPWLTHDLCQKALEGLRDLFDLCRYPEQVLRAPGGQRCLYAEMGRCDAPCDGAAPLERYRARVQAAWAFVNGEVREWIDDARQRMSAAASAQRFEEAALLKRQIAWAWKWHDHVRPVIRPVGELNYLLAIPATRRRAWRLFLFWQGELVEGPLVPQRRLADEAGPWLAGQLAPPPAGSAPVVRTEQTWLVAHFLSSKAGDASLRVALPRAEAPADLADTLRELLAQRAARPAGAEAATGAWGDHAAADQDGKSADEKELT